jgi:hypothetical protein
MTNELVKIKASDYGLEETEAQKITNGLSVIIAERDLLKEEYNKCIALEITPENVPLFKDLRLRIRDNRTKGIDVWHKNNKAFFLAGGQFCDAIRRKESGENEYMEEKLLNGEKFIENQERDRLEKLRTDRLELLKPYTEIEPLALGHMEQTVFDNYLTGVKIAHELRIAAEKKTEEDRLAAIESERVKQENVRLENERLKKEAEEKEKALEVEREEVRKSNEERERLAEIERKKATKIMADLKAKSDKERADLLAKAETQRKEKERLEKEITDKETARLKLIADEKKSREKAEKAAKLAPDKTKLLAFGQAINDLPRPEIKSIEAAAVMAQINGLLVQLNNLIITEANKL